VSEIASPSGQQPASDGRPENGRDEVSKLLVVVNAALVGVPGAYAASRSLAVTAIAALLAVVLLFTYLMNRRG
jgi:hypothetical protein